MPKTPTFHVQLFATSRALEAQQLERSYHRLRSTRKLEAPRLFLDLDSKVDIIPDTPTLLSPRTRATRRKGQVFDSPPNTSSTDSVESSDCVVNACKPSDLQPHSPSSSYIPSITGTPVTNDNHSYPGSGIPVRTKTGNKNKSIKTEGPQPLAQPFLLQLRSLPVPPTVIKARNPPVHHTAPLSSTSSSNMYSTSTSTSSTPSSDLYTPPYPRRGLTEDEKLRKLAKLARTLGENVPPELVFGSSSSPLTRTTSMSVSRRLTRSHKATQSLRASASPSSPSSAVAASPAPAEQSQSTESEPVKPQRTARPQSMTLSTATPSMAAPSKRGESLDLDPANDPPFQKIVIVSEVSDRLVTPPLEWGKRKEKGWSGEWNVKDMKDVVEGLRCLKAR